MAEVNAIPKRFVSASTFAGCGGSSLGYRLAGFDVRYANEFVGNARETYAANASPSTVIDPRDIREVSGEDILRACRVSRGELDVFDGSPPCSSFSASGKRQAAWGQVKEYSGGKRQRTDDLFFEFARLVDEVRPKVFVAENVSGLVLGAAKGYFLEILATLKGLGYRVVARVLNAEWLGVPQTRRRLIFVGVRDDLGLDPVHPSPLPYSITLREAFEGLTPPTPAELAECWFERFAVGREWATMQQGTWSPRYQNLKRSHPDAPSHTVTATASNVGAAGVAHWGEPRKFTVRELQRICSFPDDFALVGTYEERAERLGRAVPPIMMAAIATTIRERLLE